MGALTELFVAEADTVVLSLSLRKCVDCHLAHGLTEKEAGHCNDTCASLVDYMDDVSGTASLANRICSERNFTRGLCTICSFVDLRKVGL